MNAPSPRTAGGRPGRYAATGAALLALVTACGSGTVSGKETLGPDPSAPSASDSASTGAATPARDDSLGEKEWLLRLSIAGGNDGERTTALYVALTPSTGATTVTRLPGVTAGDAYGERQTLLVNADHTVAVPDSTVPQAERGSGTLTLYRLGAATAATAARSTKIDLRALTGRPKLRPVAYSFDPVDPDLLRVVDSTGGIWDVAVTGRSAKRAGALPKKRGWFFSSGFDKNSGLPFISNVDTGRTIPSGNGDLDARPVERSGGQMVLGLDGRYRGLPNPRCGFGAAFTQADGSAWLFCADTAKIKVSRLDAGGDRWRAVGSSRRAVVPPTVADFPVVLPPTDG